MTNITLRPLKITTPAPAGNPGVSLEQLWARVTVADAELVAGLKQNQDTNSYMIGRTYYVRSPEEKAKVEKEIIAEYSGKPEAAIQAGMEAIAKAQEERVKAYYDKKPRMDDTQRGIRDDLVRLWRAKLNTVGDLKSALDYKKPLSLQDFADQAAEHLEMGTTEALARVYALQELAPDKEIPSEWWDATSPALAQARADLLAVGQMKVDFESHVAQRSLRTGRLSVIDSIRAKQTLYEAGYNPNVVTELVRLG